MTGAASPLRVPVLLLVIALPALIAALYLRGAASTIVGPLAVAADRERVAVLAPGTLYLLDTAGTLGERLDGVIASETRDAGAGWVDGVLLAGPGVDGELLRCDRDGCRPFSDDPYTPTGPVQVMQADGVVWLAETEADRIHRFRADGKRIDMPLSDLSQPGCMLREGESLLVCNTGSGLLGRHAVHRRGVDYGEDFVRFTVGEGDDAIDRPLRLVAADGGGYVALYTDGRRERGILADVTADGQVTPRDLASLANPVSLARLGDDLLVVDEDLMQVVRIAADGSATLFGDESFNAQLSAQRGTRDALRLAWPLLLAVAVLCAAGGGSWLLWLLAARRPDAAREVKPGPDGVAWLPTGADLARTRVTARLVVAAPAIIVPAIAATWLGMTVAGLAWAIVVAVAAALPVQLAAMREQPAQGLRIGLKGRVLVVTDAERGMREFPLAQVAWNGQRLQPRPDLDIPLAREGLPLFHRPTLDASLFPALDPARRLPD